MTDKAGSTGGVEEVLRARDLLLARRGDYAAARRDFAWPRLETFNWALDFFDVVPPRDRVALCVVSDEAAPIEQTFGELSERSNQVANALRSWGVQKGDAVLVMMGNVVALWETFLAAMKLGAVVIPASTLLTENDLVDRIERGRVRAVVTEPGLVERFRHVASGLVRIVITPDPPDGWESFDATAELEKSFTPDGPTGADDPLLLYFTSGTTSRPKLVEHTHVSYPVGHLTTMYCIGLTPGDVHLNISSPGWAKHAWSSIFAPWLAEATALVYDYARFSPTGLLTVLVKHGVSSLCAPPTVWRMLVQEDLAAHPVSLREALAAGEPLNPEVIEQVRRAWGIVVRDYYGQTELTATIGNPPGEEVRPGSMGRPLPGYEVVLLDPDDNEADEGEICVALGDARPLGLMTGYREDDERTSQVMRGGVYRTGDVASRDADGFITYVGRVDDVFKASDYRISPFELESVLIEHSDVAEAAVVPSPDPVRTAVPKAFVVLAPGASPTPDVARSIFAHARERLAPYKRVRKLEFRELPKTVSGKIRRVELRTLEEERAAGGDTTAPGSFSEDDFPELRAQ